MRRPPSIPLAFCLAFIAACGSPGAAPASAQDAAVVDAPRLLFPDGATALADSSQDGGSSSDGAVPGPHGGWTTVAPLPEPIASLGAALANDGRIVVVGGGVQPVPNETATFSQAALAFSSASNAWSLAAKTLVAREGLAVAASGDRIYAIGGSALSDAGYPEDVAIVEAIDPATNSSKAVAPLPSARSDLAAATGSDGRIYALGGFQAKTQTSALALVDAYDPEVATPGPRAHPATDRAQRPGGGDRPRRTHLRHRRIRREGQSLATVEVYSPLTDTWSTAAPLPTAILGPAATRGPDGRIYVLGGPEFAAVSNAQAYDPADDSWHALPPLPTARILLAAAQGPDGRVYAIGGFSNTALAVVEALYAMKATLFALCGFFIMLGCGASQSDFPNHGASPTEADAGGDALVGKDAGGAAPSCAPNTDFTSDKENCGSCGHSCLGGSCVGGTCQAFVLYDFGDDRLSGLAVDATSVYVVDSPALGTTGLYAIPLSGGTPALLAPSPYLATADSLFADGRAVYWIPASIDRFDLTTGKDAIVLPYNPAVDQRSPNSVAVIGSSVYYALSDEDIGQGGLYAISVDGMGGPSVVAGNADPPPQLRVVDGSLVWADEAFGVGEGSLGELFPGQSAVITQTGDNPVAVVADATSFYYLADVSGNDGDLRRRPKAGGPSVTLYSSTNNPRRLAIDDDHVYLTESGLDVALGDVLRFSKATGAAQTLASGLTYPDCVVADATSLYIETQAQVLRIARP